MTDNAEKPKRKPGRPKKVLSAEEMDNMTRYRKEMEKQVKAEGKKVIKAMVEEKAKKKKELGELAELINEKKLTKEPKPKRVRKNDALRTQRTNEVIRAKPKIFGKVTKRAKLIDYDFVTECAALGLTHAEIAAFVDMSTGGFTNRLTQDEQLRAAIEKGRAQGTRKASSMLSELIEEKNLGAIIFYLKARCGWSDRMDINLQGKMEQEINIKNMSDAELLKIIGKDTDSSEIE